MAAFEHEVIATGMLETADLAFWSAQALTVS